MEITRISNAGVLVEYKGKRVVIDGLNSGEIYSYYGTDPRAFQKLMESEDLDYLLFTHSHEDHFNAVMVMNYMEKHPSTRTIAPASTLEKLMLCGIPTERLLAAEDIPFDSDFEICAFRTVHIGAPYRNVLHYSYFLRWEESLLFTGDAIPVASNYFQLENACSSVDVLVGNYAHIIGAGIRTVSDTIRPKTTVVVHLPDPLLDPEGLNHLAVQAVSQHRGMEINILNLNQHIIL